jgi:hypothetical protein
LETNLPESCRWVFADLMGKWQRVRSEFRISFPTSCAAPAPSSAAAPGRPRADPVSTWTLFHPDHRAPPWLLTKLKGSLQRSAGTRGIANPFLATGTIQIPMAPPPIVFPAEVVEPGRGSLSRAGGHLRSRDRRGPRTGRERETKHGFWTGLLYHHSPEAGVRG